jgi:hypothetical protein
MKPRQSKQRRRRREPPITDGELDRWLEELRAAEEADAASGEVADIPEAPPLPTNPGEVFAIFFQRKRGGR